MVLRSLKPEALAAGVRSAQPSAGAVTAQGRRVEGRGAVVVGCGRASWEYLTGHQRFKAAWLTSLPATGILT